MSAPHEHAVLSRTQHYVGPVFTVATDEVTMPGGGVARRDMVEHKGAVAVVALDDADRVALVRQYRHPVRKRLWELPAGLCDVADEELAGTAARELAEEADLRAGRFDLLVDIYTSPGFSNEKIRIFLARDLSPVPAELRHERHDEEADIELDWQDLDKAVAMVFSGEICNGPAVSGLLAAARARDEGWAALRPAGTPSLSLST